MNKIFNFLKTQNITQLIKVVMAIIAIVEFAHIQFKDVKLKTDENKQIQ